MIVVDNELIYIYDMIILLTPFNDKPEFNKPILEGSWRIKLG